MATWLTRRGVVTTGVAAVATMGVAGGASLVACGTGEAAAVARLDRLDDALSDIPFAKRISSAFKHDHAPGEILEELKAHKALHVAMQTSCPTTRRAMIRQICRDDFQAGACQVVDRLVVSRTECLISALRA